MINWSSEAVFGHNADFQLSIWLDYSCHQIRTPVRYIKLAVNPGSQCADTPLWIKYIVNHQLGVGIYVRHGSNTKPSSWLKIKCWSHWLDANLTNFWDSAVPPCKLVTCWSELPGISISHQLSALGTISNQLDVKSVVTRSHSILLLHAIGFCCLVKQLIVST